MVASITLTLPMVGRSAPPDPRSAEERAAARKDFETQMRQSAMEFDSLDTRGGAEDGNGDTELDFKEFSRLIRERELGVHSEYALRERFDSMDLDKGGSIDLTEYITFALRDAFVRSAAHLADLFSAWDEDGSGQVDASEFRKVVRHYGFRADDAIIE